MLLARNLVLPLDEVFVYKQDNFLEYCNSQFGESLGKILYDYTNNPSIDIFNQNKHVLLDGYLEYDKNKWKQRNFFFYRFEKIIRLLEYWLEHGSWRDPVVVISNPRIKGKKIYFAHPGKDRVLIMKALNIKEYNFLEFDREQTTENNFLEIKKYWGEFSSNLSLEYSSDIDQYTILNKDNIDEILTFKRSLEWFKSNKPLEIFLTK